MFLVFFEDGFVLTAMSADFAGGLVVVADHDSLSVGITYGPEKGGTYRAAGALSKGGRSCGRKIWLCPARARDDRNEGCLGSSSKLVRPV